MKFFIVACALLAVAYAAEEVQVITDNRQINEDGSFQYQLETSNGINLQQQGSLKTIGDTQAEVFQGQFSYPTPDGKTISVVYTADENGYQPQGDVIPVPPAIPVLIEKALKYLSEHPESQTQTRK